MEIHIGQIIKRVVNEKKYSVARLAEAMGIKGGSLSRVYSYPSMNTLVLQKISTELKYDFFQEYSKELNLEKEEIKKEEIKEASNSEKLLTENAAEIAALKKEIGYLTQINELLLKKK